MIDVFSLLQHIVYMKHNILYERRLSYKGDK